MYVEELPALYHDYIETTTLKIGCSSTKIKRTKVKLGYTECNEITFTRMKQIDRLFKSNVEKVF